MKIYHLEQKQLLNETIEKVWDFLSTPKNLDEITPKDMKFEITSSLPPKIHSGLIITYKIEVFPLIKYNWVTEIKSVVSNHYFIDEQRFGPYRFWHHQHKIEIYNGKSLMTDTIYYALPFGWFGKLLHKIFIRKKLEQIFQFRYEYLDKKFNKI